MGRGPTLTCAWPEASLPVRSPQVQYRKTSVQTADHSARTGIRLPLTHVTPATNTSSPLGRLLPRERRLQSRAAALLHDKAGLEHAGFSSSSEPVVC